MLDLWNWKTLLRKFKDLNKWRDRSSVLIGRLHIIKMPFLHKLIYQFEIIAFNNSKGFFIETDKLILTHTR